MWAQYIAISWLNGTICFLLQDSTLSLLDHHRVRSYDTSQLSVVLPVSQGSAGVWWFRKTKWVIFLVIVTGKSPLYNAPVRQWERLH